MNFIRIPWPFDPFSYTEYTHAYLTYADVTERAPIFLCYACWNICNIATLTAGLLLIFLAFSAKRLFQGRLWKTVEKSGAAGDTLDSFFARGSNGVPRNKNEKIDVADDLSESGTVGGKSEKKYETHRQKNSPDSISRIVSRILRSGRFQFERSESV